MKSKCLRVLFITHYSRYYGANRSLLQLILELRSNYHINPLVIVPSQGQFTQELMKYDILFEVHHFYNWLNPKNQFFKSIFKSIINQFLFYKIGKSLKKRGGKIDLVHSNSSATNLGGYLSNRFGIAHVWHIREFGDKDYNLSFTYGKRYATDYINRNSDIIILISQSLHRHYREYFKSKKAKVIYNGLPVPLAKEKQFNTKNSLNICSVGVISDSKNQMEVILACENLFNNQGISDFQLHLIGEGNEEYVNRLKNFVRKKGLERNVTFLGYLNDVESYIQKMDLGIVPSKSEAFGRVTIEYMMKSMPVIASNCGANSELVKHKQSGYLYTLGDYVEMAGYIRNFIQNKADLERMGCFARNYAVEEFSSEKNSNEIHNVYMNILQHN